MFPGECDPACMKIIRNSGFVAILAARLAGASNNERIRGAAADLAVAAEMHTAILKHAHDTGIITPSAARAKFDGCDQATKLTEWIDYARRNLADPDGLDDILATMSKWTNAEYAGVASLVSGGKETP